MKLTPDEKAIAKQVSAERLLDHTAGIAQKVRLSGSPDEQKAFHYIRRQLRGWGFEIEEHRPECWTSWPGAALLEILGDTPQTIPCITHAMATSTPPGGVTLDLVDGGITDDAALARQPVRGRGRARPLARLPRRHNSGRQ